MKSEVEVLKTETVVYPLIFANEKVAENKIAEVINVDEATNKNVSAHKENRFARLKKHLRKRSASIL